MATEISFEAALRDARSGEPRARNIAVRNLAPGLLEASALPSPSWRAADAHPRGSDVLTLLRAALEPNDRDPGLPGLALVGLAQLGEAEAWELASTWLEHEDGTDPREKDAIVFARECAVIALGLLGRAAPREGADASEGRQLRARCVRTLSTALRSPKPDVRFQAAMSLAELVDESNPEAAREVERSLVVALDAETSPEVMRNQVAALSTFSKLRVETLACLARRLEGEHADSEAAFRAALALAAAGDPRADAALVDALHHPERRDRALEALAARGPAAPEAALPMARKLAAAWLTPPVTRVRAAYLLARLTPEEGRAQLTRLARSLRPAVRAAVRDAARALETLERRGEAPETARHSSS